MISDVKANGACSETTLCDTGLTCIPCPSTDGKTSQTVCMSQSGKAAAATYSLRNFGNSVYPACQCISGETLKAVGPFYMVSMPGEVKYPTSLLWKCVTCCGPHHPLLETTRPHGPQWKYVVRLWCVIL